MEQATHLCPHWGDPVPGALVWAADLVLGVSGRNGTTMRWR